MPFGQVGCPDGDAPAAVAPAYPGEHPAPPAAEPGHHEPPVPVAPQVSDAPPAAGEEHPLAWRLMQQAHVLPGPVAAVHGIKLVQAARVPASAGRLTQLPGDHQGRRVKPRHETPLLSGVR